MLLVLIYVDEKLFIGADQFDQLISDLNKSFALKTLGSISCFLGFEAYIDNTGLYLTQHKCVQDFLMIKTNMTQAKPTSTPMCDKSKSCFN